MGQFRFLFKPVKRFLFYIGDTIADRWYLIALTKYKNKHKNKYKKLGINYQNTIDNINFKNYSIDLEQKLTSEKGLSHGKVREYWLRRGPRLLLVLIITIGSTVSLSHWLINPTRNEHILSILIGINMILFNMYLLYQRLADSISGAMMKIGHDHYTVWKSNVNLQLISIP